MNLKKPKFWDYQKISIWAILLFPITILYRFIFLTNKFLKTTKQFPIPVICIGNIYLGGTGKTPLAMEIFKINKFLNKNPAFVRKPYRYVNDEIEMLKKFGKIFTLKDRASSISSLINSKFDVAILDDGFQDFSISPNLSILCFNSKQLIGNGFVIPSGPLRESFSSIKRADCIFINGEKNLEFERKIKNLNSNSKIFYSKYKIKNSKKFINKKIIAFAGIGNPENFFHLLKENNINIKKTYSFPDHYSYSENDFNKIIENKNIKLVTTEKDYLRMNDEQKQRCDFVKIELEIKNKNELINLIKNKI
jgi:tetraacyldisaccharide 4'-kinase